MIKTISKSQMQHLEMLRECGQVVRSIVNSNNRACFLSEPGARASVLDQLVKLGLSVTESESSNGTTVTRWSPVRKPTFQVTTVPEKKKRAPRGKKSFVSGQFSGARK